VATPQLGNTQDVACRAWLSAQGLKVSQTGGDVLVVPLANPDQLGQFLKGEVDGVWTVEPWVSRLLLEAKAKVFLEEADAPTTVLVASAKLLSKRRDLARRFAQAHAELTALLSANPEQLERQLAQELSAETRREMRGAFPAAARQRLAARLARSLRVRRPPSGVHAGEGRHVAPHRGALKMSLRAVIDPVESVAPEASAAILIEQVTKSYGQGRERIVALEETDLAVENGDFVCLVGPSGCGKTTLLSLVAGLEALFPWLSVLGNVMFGLKLKAGLTRNERRDAAHHYLRLVGLEGRATASVHELSGGMKQRAALARSLAPDPRVLLMDEPFCALDALTREQLYQDLQRIWEGHRKTVVFVTHNVREAVCLGDQVLVFSPAPGKIQARFSVDLPRPRDLSSVAVAKLASEITRALRRGQTRALG
jgi:NitT/TauT family transport system ATP-binding protein